MVSSKTSLLFFFFFFYCSKAYFFLPKENKEIHNPYACVDQYCRPRSDLDLHLYHIIYAVSANHYWENEFLQIFGYLVFQILMVNTLSKDTVKHLGYFYSTEGKKNIWQSTFSQEKVLVWKLQPKYLLCLPSRPPFNVFFNIVCNFMPMCFYSFSTVNNDLFAFDYRLSVKLVQKKSHGRQMRKQKEEDRYIQISSITSENNELIWTFIPCHTLVWG